MQLVEKKILDINYANTFIKCRAITKLFFKIKLPKLLYLHLQIFFNIKQFILMNLHYLQLHINIIIILLH